LGSVSSKNEKILSPTHHLPANRTSRAHHPPIVLTAKIPSSAPVRTPPSASQLPPCRKPARRFSANFLGILRRRGGAIPPAASVGIPRPSGAHPVGRMTRRRSRRGWARCRCGCRGTTHPPHTPWFPRRSRAVLRAGSFRGECLVCCSCPW
jgi:hypothetical protein